jgi:hypothetical protein
LENRLFFYASSGLGEEILQAYIATTKIFAFENKLQYVLAKCGEVFTQVELMQFGCLSGLF